MSTRFFGTHGLIVVTARLTDPSGSTYGRFAVDTGATMTMVNAGKLEYIGCVADADSPRVEVTTASGVEYVQRVTLRALHVIRRERVGFPVICHTLPPSTGVDGLIGLDFLREYRLVIDFRAGQIELGEPA